MTDIASIVPDTATVPIAQDVVHPQQQLQQKGQVPGHLQVVPVEDSVSSRHSAGTDFHPVPSSNTLLNDKMRSDSDDKEHAPDSTKTAMPPANGQESAEKPKTGVFSTILEMPVKGPRNGIHWGAGMQSLETLCVKVHARIMTVAT